MGPTEAVADLIEVVVQEYANHEWEMKSDQSLFIRYLVDCYATKQQVSSSEERLSEARGDELRRRIFLTPCLLSPMQLASITIQPVHPLIVDHYQ